MSTLKKVVSFLLIVSMVASFAVIAISAESTPAPGSYLYSEDFERFDVQTKSFLFPEGRKMGSNQYTGAKATVKLVSGGSGRIGDASNHSAVLINTPNNWNCSNSELIPASAFQGLGNFTVSFDMIYHNHLTEAPDFVSGGSWAKFVFFSFPIAESGWAGNYVTAYWNELYNGNDATDVSGVAKVTAENWNSYFDKPVHWEIVYVAGTGESDSTITVKMDGNTISTRTNAKTGAPYGMYLTLCDAILQLDNLKVVNDATSETVYLNDFETAASGVGGYKWNPNFVGISSVTQSIVENAGNRSLLWTDTYATYQGSTAAQFAASFVTKEQLKGAKKITLSFDAVLEGTPVPHTDGTTMSYAYLHLGQNDEIAHNSLKGIWVTFNSESTGDAFSLRNSGTTIETTTLERFSVLGQNVHFTVTYDSENKTFQMWAGETKLFDVDFKQDYYTNSKSNDIELTATMRDNMVEGDVMFGVNGNASIGLDNILVTAGSAADRGLSIGFCGTQASAAVTDNKYAIRFVGGIGSEIPLGEITEIGFRVVASFGVNEVDYYANGVGSCEFVYEQINGNAQGAPQTYTAASLGYTYLLALTIQDIPTSAGTVTFTVTPYYTNASGTVFGESYTVVCENSTVVSQTLVR